jgi:ribonuclease P protein component
MKLKPIKDKNKIDIIFEKGTLLRGKDLSIKLYNFNDNSLCYGLAVPKKNIPLANKRNLIKRRLRAAVSKTSFPELNIGVSFFIVYTSKKVLTSLEIENDFKKLRTVLSDWANPS